MNNFHHLRTIVLLALSLILSMGCSNKNKEIHSEEDSVFSQDSTRYELKSPVVIQLPESHHYKHEFFMSEIVEDINYIPLETTSDCLLKGGQTSLTDKYIFTETDGKLFMFNRDGKFLRRINTVGQGPGECDLRDFGIDEQSQLIHLFDNWSLSIKTYDFNGHFQNEIKNPFLKEPEPDDNSPWGMYCDKKGNIVFTFSNSSGNMKYKYAVMDKHGEMIYKAPNYDLYDNKNRVYVMTLYPIPLYLYNNTLHYNYIFNDTVFKIEDDYSCQPAYIIRTPKKITLEKQIKTSTREIAFSDWSGSFEHHAAREDHRYIYIYSGYRAPYIGLLSRYDKRTGDLMENINPKIINDWDGGPDIELNPLLQTEDFLVYQQQPFQMKESLTDEHFEKTKVAFPEKRDSLKSMLNNMQEDDNPVLMIVKLKN